MRAGTKMGLLSRDSVGLLRYSLRKGQVGGETLRSETCTVFTWPDDDGGYS